MNGGKTQPAKQAKFSASESFGSWKEIAAYLKRDERTVRRWEKEGLPIHRHLHNKRASVYAYRAEIDAWWAGDRARAVARQEVRFCASSDGVRLAYALSGNGPPLVRSPHWFTHIDHDWTNPAIRPWVEDLSRRYTFLRFDQRGTGLSDRDVPEISPEAHVRDLECVVDAAGLERFALLGASQGAAFAVVYAARHPERVSHLIIYGGFVRGWARRGWSAERLAQLDTQVKLIEFGWGSDDPSFRQVFSTQFMPDAPLEAIHAFNDFMPLTASAKTAATIFKTNGLIDVQDEARRVRVPTLVLHGRSDVRLPYEEGRIIASLIPGSRFVTLETRNHLVMQTEQAWRDLLSELDAFYPSPALA